MSSARRAADGNRKEYKTRTETRRLVGSRTGQNLKVTDLPLSSPLSDRVGLWAFSIRRIPLVRGALHPTSSGEFRNCPSRPPHSTATPHKDDSRPSCRPSCRPTSRPRANQRILTLSATAPPNWQPPQQRTAHTWGRLNNDTSRGVALLSRQFQSLVARPCRSQKERQRIKLKGIFTVRQLQTFVYLVSNSRAVSTCPLSFSNDLDLDHRSRHFPMIPPIS